MLIASLGLRFHFYYMFMSWKTYEACNFSLAKIVFVCFSRYCYILVQERCITNRWWLQLLHMPEPYKSIHQPSTQCPRNVGSDSSWNVNHIMLLTFSNSSYFLGKFSFFAQFVQVDGFHKNSRSTFEVDDRSVYIPHWRYHQMVYTHSNWVWFYW